MKAEDNQFPYLTLAEGATPPATPGAGLVRAYVDADDGRLYLVDDTGVAHPVAFTTDPAAAGALGDLTDVDTAGAAAGQVLGTTDGATWGPVTPSSGGGGADTLDLAVVTSLTQSSSSLTFAAITGAAVTFTVPASGAVVVEASGGTAMEGGHSLELCLLDGGSPVANSIQRVLRISGQGRFTYRHVLTGLTSGASKTYSLAMRRGDGTTYDVTVLADSGAGQIWGQLVMEARSTIAP